MDAVEVFAYKEGDVIIEKGQVSRHTPLARQTHTIVHTPYTMQHTIYNSIHHTPYATLNVSYHIHHTYMQVGNVFYMIKEGKVMVSNMGEAFADHTLGPGDYFGERALLTGMGFVSYTIHLLS